MHDNITMNGHDWSNMFILEYQGGGGGEMLMSLIAEAIKSPSHPSKLYPPYLFSDNVFSYLAGIVMSEHHRRWILNGDTHIQDLTDDEVRANIKLLSFLQTHGGDNYEDAKFIDSLSDELLNRHQQHVINKWHHDRNIIVRTHSSDGRFSSGFFPGSTYISLKTSYEDHTLKTFLMFMKEWFKIVPDEALVYSFTPPQNEIIKRELLDKQGGIAYSWQIHELASLSDIKTRDIETFVDYRTKFYDFSKEPADNIISTGDWLFDRSNEWKDTLRNLNIPIRCELAKGWQDSNCAMIAAVDKSVFVSHNSLKQHLKDYWHSLNMIDDVSHIRDMLDV